MRYGSVVGDIFYGGDAVSFYDSHGFYEVAVVGYQDALAGFVDDHEAGVDAHGGLDVQVRETAVSAIDGEGVDSAAGAGFVIEIGGFVGAVEEAAVGGDAEAAAVQVVELLGGF